VPSVGAWGWTLNSECRSGARARSSPGRAAGAPPARISPRAQDECRTRSLRHRESLKKPQSLTDCLNIFKLWRTRTPMAFYEAHHARSQHSKQCGFRHGCWSVSEIRRMRIRSRQEQTRRYNISIWLVDSFESSIRTIERHNTETSDKEVIRSRILNPDLVDLIEQRNPHA